MDQKERIIEQAMHMFVSQGIKSVRMDDIAQQLGVSKRTLYELFGDKEGLLYLAMDRYFEKKRIERAAVCAHARNVLEAMFMVLGGVIAGIFGFLIGVPVLRLNGDYLAIVTLAFGEIIKNVIMVLYVGLPAGCSSTRSISIWPFRCFTTRLRPSPCARTSFCPRA